jgi:hypothetical protein
MEERIARLGAPVADRLDPRYRLARAADVRRRRPGNDGFAGVPRALAAGTAAGSTRAQGRLRQASADVGPNRRRPVASTRQGVHRTGGGPQPFSDLGLPSARCSASQPTSGGTQHRFAAIVSMAVRSCVSGEKPARRVARSETKLNYRHLLSQPRRGRRDGEPPEALPRARVASPPSSTLRWSVGPSRRSAVTRLRATDRHRAGRQATPLRERRSSECPWPAWR